VYVALKIIHILAVVAFLGNISTGIFWKYLADRTGDAKIIAHTIRGIITSDRFITIPSIVVIVAAGVVAAVAAQLPLMHTAWILWSIVLLVISGLAFGPLSRTQIKLAETAESGMGSDDQRELYRRLSHQWDLWGALALGAPLIIVVLMVLKPA